AGPRPRGAARLGVARTLRAARSTAGSIALATKSRSQLLTAARIRPATSNSPGPGSGATGTPDGDADVVGGTGGPGGVVVAVGGDVVLVGAGWAVAERGVSQRLLHA